MREIEFRCPNPWHDSAPARKAMKCPECPARKPNDIDAWYDAAKAVGLASVFHPEANELVIFNRDHLDRGWLWIKSHSLIGKRDDDPQNPVHDLEPADALALLGRLSRRVVEPIK